MAHVLVNPDKSLKNIAVHISGSSIFDDRRRWHPRPRLKDNERVATLVRTAATVSLAAFLSLWPPATAYDAGAFASGVQGQRAWGSITHTVAGFQTAYRDQRALTDAMAVGINYVRSI